MTSQVKPDDERPVTTISKSGAPSAHTSAPYGAAATEEAVEESPHAGDAS